MPRTLRCDPTLFEKDLAGRRPRGHAKRARVALAEQLYDVSARMAGLGNPVLIDRR